jgi:hypothetical protein
MSKARFLASIQARDGCILYFPHRKADKVIVMAGEATRRGWGERWFQVRIEPIKAEVRLEGDNALDLGRGLSCNVVAKLEAQIDTSDELSQALSLAVKRFLCSPTNDLDSILGRATFAEPLGNELRANVLDVMAGVGYRDVLDDPSRVGKLEGDLKNRMESFLVASGFRMLSCGLRVELLKPLTTGAEPDIARKWMDWEISKIELEKEIEHRKSKSEADAIVKQRELKEEQENRIRAIELRELDMFNDFITQKTAKETAKATTEEQGRVNISEAGRDAKQYFEDRRKELLLIDEEQKAKERDAAHRATLDETEKAAAIKQREQELEQERLLDELTHKNLMRQTGIDAEDAQKNAQTAQQLAREANKAALNIAVHNRKLEQAKQKLERLRTKAEAADLEKAAALVEIEIAKARGLAAAEIAQAKGRAEHMWKKEMLDEHVKAITAIQASLPEILKSLPAARSGETTLIQIGGSGGNSDTINDGASLLGMIYFPIIKKIVDRFTGDNVEVDHAPDNIKSEHATEGE